MVGRLKRLQRPGPPKWRARRQCARRSHGDICQQIRKARRLTPELQTLKVQQVIKIVREDFGIGLVDLTPVVLRPVLQEPPEL